MNEPSPWGAQTAVDRSGVSIAVFDTGPAGARPVLLAHGLTWDHRELDGLARLLADLGHRVVSYDARGVGASSRRLPAPTAHTIAEMAADCDAVIASLDGPRPVIGGASMGAAVTLEVARSSRERIAGVVQIAPGVGPQGVADETEGYLRWIADAVRSGAWAGLRTAIEQSEQPADEIATQVALAAAWEERFDPDTFVAQITGFPQSVRRPQQAKAAAGTTPPNAIDVPGLVLAWPDDDLHPGRFAAHAASQLAAPPPTLVERPTSPDLPARSLAEPIDRFVRQLS